MKDTPIPKNFLFSHPAHFFALGFGTGLSRMAPGTVGTLLGLPLYAILSVLPFMQQLAALLILFIAGCFICDYTGKALGVIDHGGIVWDEIVAYYGILIFLPAHWAWWLCAFVLFRLFDILKPWPINWLDKHFKNGFGVMLDDLLAAIYTLAIFIGYLRFLHSS